MAASGAARHRARMVHRRDLGYTNPGRAPRSGISGLETSVDNNTAANVVTPGGGTAAIVGRPRAAVTARSQGVGFWCTASGSWRPTLTQSKAMKYNFNSDNSCRFADWVTGSRRTRVELGSRRFTKNDTNFVGGSGTVASTL